MKRLLFPLSLTALFFVSCSNDSDKSGTVPDTPATTFNLSAAKDSVVASNAAFCAAIKSGDSVAAASGYTSDALIMPPNMANVKGRAAIVSFAAETSRMGAPVFNLQTDELTGDENGLQEVGTYTVSSANGTPLDKGKFICLWKKEDGKWKIHRDIFNSDLPPPPAQPAKK